MGIPILDFDFSRTRPRRFILLTSTIYTASLVARSLTLHCKQSIYRIPWSLLHRFSIILRMYRSLSRKIVSQLFNSSKHCPRKTLKCRPFTDKLRILNPNLIVVLYSFLLSLLIFILRRTLERFDNEEWLKKNSSDSVGYMQNDHWFGAVYDSRLTRLMKFYEADCFYLSAKRGFFVRAANKW